MFIVIFCNLLRKSVYLYPKILLTLDEDPEMSYDGIRKVNALDWPLRKTI